MQTTFVLIKPDGILRKYIGKIITRFEDRGLYISNFRSIAHPSLELTQKHYAEHIGKPFYEPITQSLSSGPVVFFQVSGIDAVKIVRCLVGNTNTPGTIRGDYSCGLSHENVVHASDSTESADREIGLWYA